jgi:uncharacterized protein
MPAPDLPAAAVDLSDAEFQELDELLFAFAGSVPPMGIVTLDGYLCGVLVQPVPIEPDAWLPRVFDEYGRALPERGNAVYERARTLILRRYSALNRALVDDGWFDPLILEDALDEDGNPPPPVQRAASDPLSLVDPVSLVLMPWVYGFSIACENFHGLLEVDDPAAHIALARLYRHMPADSDEERELSATFERERPLATLNEGIEELVACVADLADLTRDARYRVDTVRREAPKVGRNDACPCGSGKKFKYCHGAN